MLLEEAVSAGTKALLDSTDRALNLTDVEVGGDHVHLDGSDLVTDAFEFVIAMEVSNNKTTGCVEFDHSRELGEDGGLFTVRDVTDCPKTDATRDGVQEAVALHKEEINAKGDVAVVLKDGWWNRCRHESGNACACHRPRGLTLNYSDVRAIDEEGASRISGRHGAVPDKIAA